MCIKYFLLEIRVFISKSKKFGLGIICWDGDMVVNGDVDFDFYD